MKEQQFPVTYLKTRPCRFIGYYLYVEASPMLPGHSARLRSRPLRGSRGPQCLRFFYHMYGSGTGQLRLHLDQDGEDVLLWQRSGEQSIAWLRAAVEYQCDSLHQARAERQEGNVQKYKADDIQQERRLSCLCFCSRLFSKPFEVIPSAVTSLLMTLSWKVDLAQVK